MKKELKIIHISTAHIWRGGEQQIAYLVEELQKLGVQQLLAVKKGGAMEAYCRKMKWPHEAIAKKSGLDWRFSHRLARLCKSQNPDFLHAHDSHGHTFAVMAWELFGCRTPVVLHRRVDFAVGKNWLSRYKYNHRSMGAIICISKAIRAILNPVIKQPEKLELVYSAVKPERFAKGAPGILRKQYQVPAEEKIIGNVAALVGHKDYFTFLDTAKMSLQEGISARFFIIGDGALKESLMEYAQELEIRDKVVFTGFRTDIEAVLPELDILLFTSQMEGLGTTILDAYAAKVPVVATRAGGIPEMVIENETALLAPVKDSMQLALHLTTLVKKPKKAQDLRHNAYQHLLQNFTTPVMAEEILKIYKKLI